MKSESNSSKSQKFSESRSRSRSKEDNKKYQERKHSPQDNFFSRSKSHSRSVSQNENQINEKKKVPNQKGPALDFMIFLSKNTENSLSSSGILKKIEESTSDVKFQFDYDFTIPDLSGCVLRVKSSEMPKKKEATQQLLDFIVKNNIDQGSEENKQSDRLSILIMVPNGLVSMIIGTKGRQISNLIRSSGAMIVVNQPIFKMLHRTVAISGKTTNVCNAITQIQSIMEERYYEVSKVEMDCKPLNITTTPTHVN